MVWARCMGRRECLRETEQEFKIPRIMINTFFSIIVRPFIHAIQIIYRSFVSKTHVFIALDHDNFILHKNLASIIPNKEAEFTSDLRTEQEFIWEYPVIIKNNSSQTAFNICWIKNNIDNTIFLPSMPILFSLQPNESKEIGNLQCVKKEIVQTRDIHSLTKKFPFYIESIDLQITYTNEKDKRYVTSYKCLNNFKQYNAIAGNQKRSLKKLSRILEQEKKLLTKI